MRRVLAICLVGLVPLLVLARADGAREAPTTRIYFASSRTLDRQIYSIESTGSGLAQLTFDATPSTEPLPSPDGRWIAFRREGSLWSMTASGRDQRRLALNASQSAWAPDSRRIAYVSTGGIWTVGFDGRGRHLTVRGDVGAPAWSPDDKSLAYSRGGSIFVLRGGVERRVIRAPATRIIWSPDGRWLAYDVGDALRLVRPDSTGRRPIGDGNRASWSPNGRLLALIRGADLVVYRVGSGRERTIPAGFETSDSISWSPDGTRIGLTSLRGAIGIITPRGRLGSVFPGLWANEIAWTTPPPTLRYRKPRPLELASANELQLRAPVETIAADGDQVAFISCRRVGVWRPRNGTVVSVREESPFHPFCGESLGLYGLALAGDQVAWGAYDGGIGIEANWLSVAEVGIPRTETLIATNGPRPNLGENVRAGHLVGDDTMLAFSTWACSDEHGADVCAYPASRPVTQTLWRVREPPWPGACPLLGGDFSYAPLQPEGRCQKLSVEPGPLVPFDVDGGRILVGGDNATLVLDAEGARLLSIPTSALGGQLAGRDLVLLRRGELRQYDVATGALVHVWPLPDVPSGGPCGKPCPHVALELEDLARGIAAYWLDGRIHLLRLSDGSDAVVAVASTARFGDEGLFYAYQTLSYPWNGRIRFVPFDQLPLR